MSDLLLNKKSTIKKFLFIVLFMVFPFFVFTQVELSVHDTTQSYPEGTYINYMQFPICHFDKDDNRILKGEDDSIIVIKDYDKLRKIKKFEKFSTNDNTKPISALNLKKWEKGGFFEGFSPKDEIVEKRSQNTKHFRKVNGEIVAQIGGNYHYQDESGQWQDIDLTIAKTKNRNFAYSNTTNSIKTFFPEMAGNIGVTIRDKAMSLTIWKNPELLIYDVSGNILYKENFLKNSPKVKDNIVQYESFNGVIDEFKIIDNGVENNIIINGLQEQWISFSDAKLISFKQFVELPYGVKVLNSKGEVETNDFTDEYVGLQFVGGEILYLNSLVVFDSQSSKEDAQLFYSLENKGKIPEDIKTKTNSFFNGLYTIKFVDNGIEIYSNVSLDWLQQAQYPVTIDPTWTVGSIMSGNSYGPLTHWYGYQRNASLYKQAEISGYGNITQIEYYKTNTAATRTKPTKVYMRSITGTTITSNAAWNSTTYTGGLSALYNGNTTQDNTVGWKAIPVSFNYTSGNLLVMVYDAYGGGGSPQLMAQETVAGLQTHKRADSSDPGDASAMETDNYRTSIRITYSTTSGPCASAITMQCGNTYTANLTSQGGEWSNYNGSSNNYPGSEQVWSFTASTTGSYTFYVNEGTANADFFLMSACSNTSTNLSSGFWSGASGGTSHTVSLVAGTTYYLIADLLAANTSTTVSVSVTCPPLIPGLNCPGYSNIVTSSNSHCSNQIYYLEVLNTNCNGEIFFDVVGNYGSAYANEITWSVVSNLTSNIVASGGPGTNGANFSTAVGPINANVQGSVFKLVVNDSYGDGFASGGYISIQQSGVVIGGSITGDFGSQSHLTFMPNLLISPATITVTTPSGNVTQTVVNCNDFRVPITINNELFCSTSLVSLPWVITCQSSNSVIASGNHNMTIYPNTPSNISDIVEISYDAANCEWVTNWQNDCTIDHLGSLFTISPDPSAPVDACVAHSPQVFTLQYHGIDGGLACCNTAGPHLPITYSNSTSQVSKISHPYGGINNAAYLTLPASGIGGNATALTITFNMSGYCFAHPMYYEPTDFWITIIIDGNEVYHQLYYDPATSASVTINLADIAGGYNQNSIIKVYVCPNTLSVTSGYYIYYTEYMPGGSCWYLYDGDWTANSFNVSVNATFEQVAPTPITCTYTGNVTKPCCTVYPVSSDEDEICSGESFDILTWKELVNDSNVGACIFYSSVLPVGGSVVPDGISPNGINNTSNTIVQTVGAYSYCDSNGNGSVDAGDTYTLLSTYTLTVQPVLTPIFTQLGPYCIGDIPAVLPLTSLNGIEGIWSPATINTATASTTTYAFTPTVGECASNATMIITITPNRTPTFTVLGPYCSGAIIPALPTTSNNGIIGTWSPAINNTSTTEYTFTPNAGLCATISTLTIAITPNVTPTFDAVGPYCSGAIIPALPTTSNNGISGTWSPAINNTSTTEYTFTPNAGLCATISTLTIAITPNVTPTFDAVGPYCSGAIIPALPTTSNNGISGTWSPAVNNTATTTYTFTPNTGECATTATLTISIDSQVSPAFLAVGPYCSGASIPALPNISNNGFEGVWTPAINNTATTTYTFTPLDGGCAIPVSMTIAIMPNETPLFASVGSYCSGTDIPALPLTSINGITGTWSPIINDTTTTTYTFTPTANQCATTTSLTIPINPQVTPTFTLVDSYCSGESIPALPLTSLNGISGTWSPAINNTVTTVYTFTPNAGQCATTATMTIPIHSQVTPIFSPVGPYCPGSVIPSLPNISNNDITGSWSPAVNNLVTTTYTFNPDIGQCASTTTLTIIIDSQVTPLFSLVGPYCLGSTIPALPTTSNNGISGTWSPAINNMATTTYTFTPNSGQCGAPTSMNVQIIDVNLNFNPNNPTCNNETNGGIELTVSGGLPDYTYEWNPAGTGGIGAQNLTGVGAGTYNVTVTDANLCASSASYILTEPSMLSISETVVNTTCDLPNGSVGIIVSGGTPQYTYQWDAAAQNATTPAVTNLTNQEYSVTVTDANQCIIIDTISVGHDVPPVLSLVEQINETCSDINGQITVEANEGKPNYIYSWAGYPGHNNPDINDISAGNYIAIVTDADGCVDSLSIVITNHEPPEVGIASIIPAHCDQSDAEISLEVIGGSGNYTYDWGTIPPRTSIHETDLPSGQYTVTVSDGVCDIEMIVDVPNLPGPSVNASANPNEVYVSKELVRFNDGSIGATSWYWDYGTGEYSHEQTPSYKYEMPGTYDVVLMVTDNYGCSASDTVNVIVHEGLEVWIPNAFTPDSDGLNELFGPIAIGMSLEGYEMEIYDRWGKQAFYTKDYYHHWDGTINGSKVTMNSVFVYRIVIYDKMGKDYIYTGRISLICGFE